MSAILTLKNAAGTPAVYNFFRNESGMQTTYIGGDHSDLSVDMIVLQSSSPARRALDYGNRRSKSNLQRGVAVPFPDGSNKVKNAKLECSASVPVGMTIAQFKELCARQAALLSSDDYISALFITGQTEIG